MMTSKDDELLKLINDCIDDKQGNDEFALFCENGRWSAEIGNPSGYVRLGEVNGELFVYDQPTAIDAVASLLKLIRAKNQVGA